MVVKIEGIDGTDVRGDDGARRLTVEELDGVNEAGGRHNIGEGGMLIGKERRCDIIGRHWLGTEELSGEAREGWMRRAACGDGTNRKRRGGG